VDWTKFRFMAFDIPNHNGSYEQRYTHLGKRPILFEREYNRITSNLSYA